MKSEQGNSCKKFLKAHGRNELGWHAGVSSGCRANCEESGERVDSACEKGEGVMSSKPIQQGSLVLLWAGEDPAVHAALLEELGVAEIPFSDKSLGDDEVAPTADPLPIDWKPRFGFEVAVLSSNLAAAQEVLEKLLEEEPADLEIPAQETRIFVSAANEKRAREIVREVVEGEPPE